MALQVDDLMDSVKEALHKNMSHSDSPLLLDKDFKVEISIYAGDYDTATKEFVVFPDAGYVGMFPIVHREPIAS